MSKFRRFYIDSTFEGTIDEFFETHKVIKWLKLSKTLHMDVILVEYEDK